MGGLAAGAAALSIARGLAYGSSETGMELLWP